VRPLPCDLVQVGAYDSVHGGFRHGQVKAWQPELRDLVPGDVVGPVAGVGDYSVRTSDGASWVNVTGGVITTVTADPTEAVAFTTTGMLDSGETTATDDSGATEMLSAAFGNAAPEPDVGMEPTGQCRRCRDVRAGARF